MSIHNFDKFYPDSKDLIKTQFILYVEYRNANPFDRTSILPLLARCERKFFRDHTYANHLGGNLMNFNQAMITKITVKKIFSLLDHLQIITAHSLGDNPLKLTVNDWCDEMRLHLRKVEYSVEVAAE